MSWAELKSRAEYLRSGMKQHAYFFGSCSVLVLGVQDIFCSCSVLVREKQQNFCSCSVLVLEQEHVHKQVLEQIDLILLSYGKSRFNKHFIANIFEKSFNH